MKTLRTAVACLLLIAVIVALGNLLNNTVGMDSLPSVVADRFWWMPDEGSTTAKVLTIVSVVLTVVAAVAFGLVDSAIKRRTTRERQAQRDEEERAF